MYAAVRFCFECGFVLSVESSYHIHGASIQACIGMGPACIFFLLESEWLQQSSQHCLNSTILQAPSTGHNHCKRKPAPTQRQSLWKSTLRCNNTHVCFWSTEVPFHSRLCGSILPAVSNASL